MLACTKRRLLPLCIHHFVVRTLNSVFNSLYVEYYVHNFLLVAATGVKHESDGGIPFVDVHLSFVGLGILVAAQVMRCCFTVMTQLGVNSFSFRFPKLLIYQLKGLLRPLSNEAALVLVFSFSWWALHLPMIPSGLTCTVCITAMELLQKLCSSAVRRLVHGMTLRRPSMERGVHVMHGTSAVWIAAVVSFAAFHLDGTVTERRRIGSFEGIMAMLSMLSFGALGGMWWWGRDLSNVGSLGRIRDACSCPLCATPDRSSPSEFHRFARQTWQRRSFKALLLVHSMHEYAHSFVTYFFHFLLTLGCGTHLSAAVRSALLAVALTVPPIIRPLLVASATALGRKRCVMLGLMMVCVTGFASLVAAFATRETLDVPGLARDGKEAGSLPKGVVFCVFLMMSQRVLLVGVRVVLNMAQEDVVEEDAVLFSRATPMAAGVRRLLSIVAVPAQALCLTQTLVYLVAARVLCGIPPSSLSSMSLSPPLNGVPLATSSITPSTALSVIASEHSVQVVASPSAVLLLIGLQTFLPAMVMLGIWCRYYNLDGSHLKFIQMATHKQRDEQHIILV